jgi:hypothetical protein
LLASKGASLMLKFAQISFRLPDFKDAIISDFGSLTSSGKQLDFFVVKAASGEKFNIAVNPYLLRSKNSESLLGVCLHDLIKQSAADAEEQPFFIIDTEFSPISGDVKSTRTFSFGNIIISEMLIEKSNSGNLARVAFIPHRRRRRQEAGLTSKNITISPDLLIAKIGKKQIKWDGNNLPYQKEN